MNEEEFIEIHNGIEEEVKHNIKAVNIAGLDLKKAEELGVFMRISYMLCLMHNCIAAAYRIYGNVDYMLELIHGKKHEINKTCKQFEKDYERFMKFWRHYQSDDAVQDQNEENEKLYHQIMRWAQFPENWKLGDEQHIDDDKEVLIRIALENCFLKLGKGFVDGEQLAEPVDKWAVTRLNPKTHEQITVHTDMDKASAQMCAKRLSAEDAENIYTATILRTIEERRTDALPMKAYKGGEVVGKIGKVFKK